VSEGLTGETGIRTQAGVIGAPHGEDFKATLCFLAAFALVGLVWAEDAVAVNLTSPSAGAATSSTPTFTWQLGPGEESSTIEISPNPAPGGGGGFANDEQLVTDILDEGQTSFTIGNASPLSDGVWYWHVSVFRNAPCCDFRWSAIRSIRVPDEKIRLRSFDLDYLSCIKTIDLTFEYTDNSRDQFARWTLDFKTRKHGHRVVRKRGTADEHDFGTVFEFFNRPKQLRTGKLYFARLKLEDRAGHVTKSHDKRLRVGRC
jgi:hypothetical protein